MDTILFVTRMEETVSVQLLGLGSRANVYIYIYIKIKLYTHLNDLSSTFDQFLLVTVWPNILQAALTHPQKEQKKEERKEVVHLSHVVAVNDELCMSLGVMSKL